MSPNILEVMSFRMSTRVTATVVCCILTQILCVVSQKKLQLLGDFVPHSSYRGSAPGPCWGRPPAGAPLLGSPDPQSYFMSLPIILWDRHPYYLPTNAWCTLYLKTETLVLLASWFLMHSCMTMFSHGWQMQWRWWITDIYLNITKACNRQAMFRKSHNRCFCKHNLQKHIVKIEIFFKHFSLSRCVPVTSRAVD